MAGRVVLAFDLAGRCGVAWGPVGGRPEATTIDLDRKGLEDPRLAKALRATQEILDRVRPDVLVYERPIGGPTKDDFLWMLAGCFRGQAALMGYNPIAVAISTARSKVLGHNPVKKQFPGKPPQQAEAVKAFVIGRCGLLGWSPRNHDEADAMVLWGYGAAVFGRGQLPPVGGLFDQVPA